MQGLVKKADLALSDLTTNNGGLILPEQGLRFIRKLQEAPTMINEARLVAMSRPSRKIAKIGFGSRILKKATQGTALHEAGRSQPDMTQLELNTKEFIAEVRIPYAVFEDNIEGGNINFGGTGVIGGGAPNGGLVDTLIDMIAERAAVDLEEICLTSDTAQGGLADELKQFDGWLKLAGAVNKNDVAKARVNRTMFKKGLQTLANKYKRDKVNMRHYVSPDQELEYADGLAGRETAMGDAKHQNPTPNYGAGVMVRPVALMPDAKGILTNPKNLILGIQRDFSIEVDKDITTREWIIVLTLRADVQIEENEACVLYDDIGTSF
jgi:hypothetical protein